MHIFDELKLICNSDVSIPPSWKLSEISEFPSSFEKKKLSELKLSEFSLFFRRYAHIRVGDPAQSRNFQKNKTGIAAHKVWSKKLSLSVSRGAPRWSTACTVTAALELPRGTCWPATRGFFTVLEKCRESSRNFREFSRRSRENSRKFLLDSRHFEKIVKKHGDYSDAEKFCYS